MARIAWIGVPDTLNEIDDRNPLLNRWIGLQRLPVPARKEKAIGAIWLVLQCEPLLVTPQMVLEAVTKISGLKCADCFACV